MSFPFFLGIPEEWDPTAHGWRPAPMAPPPHAECYIRGDIGTPTGSSLVLTGIRERGLRGAFFIPPDEAALPDAVRAGELRALIGAPPQLKPGASPMSDP